MLFAIHSFGHRLFNLYSAKLKVILPLLLSVSVELGCNPLHQNAEILMDGEEYGEAAKVYSQILDTDPADAKAMVGLKKARTRWIDKTLIDVRMLRLSQQATTATELLKKIITREQEWQFYPEGAVQFTQEEETQYAVRLIATQIANWQTQGRILKARAYIEGYRQIFATPALVNQRETLTAQLASTANEQCQTYKKLSSPSLPYFMTFAKLYCDSWGISFDAGFDVAKTRADSLFKGVEIISNDISGIPEALYPYGRETLEKEFEATAWYERDATSSLQIFVKASFAHEHKKTMEGAVHSYTVKVPYTVMVPQMRSVPHTTYQQICSSYGCTSIPNTTYTYETYMIPITEYRDDPRQFHYERWRHTQALAFHAELLSSIHGVDAEASHTQTANDTDTEHPHSVPEIGLSPKSLSLSNPLAWLEKQIAMAAHKWGRTLTNVWIKTYCNSPETSVDETTAAEYVFRCLREKQDPIPSFAEIWFKEKHGADYQTVQQWLDRSRDGPIPPPDIQE